MHKSHEISKAAEMKAELCSVRQECWNNAIAVQKTLALNIRCDTLIHFPMTREANLTTRICFYFKTAENESHQIWVLGSVEL